MPLYNAKQCSVAYTTTSQRQMVRCYQPVRYAGCSATGMALRMSRPPPPQLVSPAHSAAVIIGESRAAHACAEYHSSYGFEPPSVLCRGRILTYNFMLSLMAEPSDVATTDDNLPALPPPRSLGGLDQMEFQMVRRPAALSVRSVLPPSADCLTDACGASRACYTGIAAGADAT